MFTEGRQPRTYESAVANVLLLMIFAFIIQFKYIPVCILIIFLFCNWPFLHVCTLQGNTSALIFYSVFSNYVVFYQDKIHSVDSHFAMLSFAGCYQRCWTRWRLFNCRALVYRVTFCLRWSLCRQNPTTRKQNILIGRSCGAAASLSTCRSLAPSVSILMCWPCIYSLAPSVSIAMCWPCIYSLAPSVSIAMCWPCRFWYTGELCRPLNSWNAAGTKVPLHCIALHCRTQRSGWTDRQCWVHALLFLLLL